MIRNYIKTAWRNLRKNTGYSIINIGGLAIGISVALFIGLWVYDELSFDHSFTNINKIAEVSRLYTQPLNRETDNSVWLPQPMAKVLRNDYGRLFKHVLITRGQNDYSLTVGHENFLQKGQFIENGIIDMLSLKMIRGNDGSLNDQKSIILSESAAKAVFGDSDPLDKLIRIENRMEAKVTGIFKDLPANSSFGNVRFFANYNNLLANTPGIKIHEDDWGHTSHFIYTQIADHINPEQANAAIRDLYYKNAPPDFAAGAKKYDLKLWLYPMNKWYLFSEFRNGYPASGRITYVWLFSIIGVFVLLLACINFMNLSTARSEKRSREVGVRKVMGSSRTLLITQFLSESLMVVSLAFGIAVFLSYVLLPYFNILTQKSICLPLFQWQFWMLAIPFLAFTGLIAGVYPALYLSSFQPVKVLKGTFRLNRFASYPRKILVVVQFSVSIALITGTIVIYRQIIYAKDRPVGYNKESLLAVNVSDPGFKNNKSAVRQDLLSHGIASEVAFSSSPVTAIWDNYGGFSWTGKDPKAESSFSVTWVNEDFGKTVHWTLIDGRDFSRDYGLDTSAVIINSTAAKYLGLKRPVGEFIRFDGDGTQRQIIGVVEDIVAESPFERVRAGFYWLQKNPDELGQMEIKLNPKIGMSDALRKTEAIMKQTVPGAPFLFKFADQEYELKFSAEQKVSNLSTLFAVLAISISCLGIFGLASFIAEQRAREIGIRKVLGASVYSLWHLLSRDFVVLVLVSCCIATPPAYYFMQHWLQGYEYRTDISWWIFAAAGVGALLITLLTVSFQAIKAALTNPTRSLRSE